MTVPPHAEMASRLKIGLRAAEQAGAVLMRHFGASTPNANISPKARATLASQEAELTARSELHAAFRQDAIVAEHAGGIAGPQAQRWCWVIAPLDGVSHFAEKQRDFCTSIGLLHFGASVLGIVVAPARRQIFVGGLGLAATCNGQPIAVSQVATLSQAQIATGLADDCRAGIAAPGTWLESVERRAYRLCRSGPAALDLCAIAVGHADAFCGTDLVTWNLVGPCAIVHAAGGRTSTFSGASLDRFAGPTLASNGLTHAELIALVRGANAVRERPPSS